MMGHIRLTKVNIVNPTHPLPQKKHTHTQKIIIIIIKKMQYQDSYPRNKHPYNTPDKDPNSNSQGIGAVNCRRKDLDITGCRDPRSTSFLFKCNLTKSYLSSVSLLKHFSISC